MSFAGAYSGNAPYKGYQLITYEWVFFGLTTPFVLTRVYVQYRFRFRPWREIFIILAWALYLVDTVCDNLQNHYGWFTSDGDAGFYTPTNRYAIPYLKISLLHLVTFKVAIYFCKFALLLFYLDLTPRQTYTKTWWAILFTWFWCIFGTIFQILVPFLLCRPFSDHWDLSRFQCSDAPWFFIFSWTLFLFTDLLVYMIPFFILYNLETLDYQQKRAAYWMFAAGLINIISACIMLACYIVPGFHAADSKRSAILGTIFNFLSPFQQSSAIMIVCLPQVRRFCLGMSEEAMRRRRDNMMRKRASKEAEKMNRGSSGAASWGRGADAGAGTDSEATAVASPVSNVLVGINTQDTAFTRFMESPEIEAQGKELKKTEIKSP